jgi:hypothetical protein
MALGSSGVVAAVFTPQQWLAVVGGLLAVGSAVWSYIAAHPSKVNPLQAVERLVRAGGQSAQWDAAIARLEPLLVAMAERGARAAIHARAGILAGPLDAVADKAIQTGADTAAGHLKIS